MEKAWDKFERKFDFLLCIDSDGSAMDTMNIKHERCFGPCLLREWALEDSDGSLLRLWNEINLYSQYRGVNRFLGLALFFRRLEAAGRPGPDRQVFETWLSSGQELSNRSLEAFLQEHPDAFLAKVKNWSEAVNEAISRLPESEMRPFEGVGAALAALRHRADIAVVSSANRAAIEGEWQRYDLLEHTDILLSQSEGSKAACIGRLLQFGYDRERVLMLGDAPGDRQAAEHNGVLFYPIIPGQETASWRCLGETAAERFFGGTYAGAYQASLNEDFERALCAEHGGFPPAGCGA